MGYLTEHVSFLIALLVPLILFISIPIRFYSKTCKVTYAPNSVILIILFLTGCATVAIFPKQLLKHPDICTKQFKFVLFPIYIISTMYRVDYLIFKRCLKEILVISMLGYAIRCVVFALVLFYVIYPEWRFDNHTHILHAIDLTFTQPSYVLLLLKELSRYKYLATILEAESVISLGIAELAFQGVERARGIDELPNDEQLWLVVDFVGCAIFVCGVFGFLLGKLTAMILYWIFNDIQAILTVVFGMSFIIYFLTETYSPGSGSLTMVFYSINMVSNREKLQPDVDMVLRKLTNITYYIVEIIAYILIMYDVCRLTYLFFNFKDFILSSLIYTTSLVIRFVTMALLGLILKRLMIPMKCLLLLGWCDIKGSLNMTMTMTLLEEIKSKKLKFCISTDILACVMLSLLINSSTMRATLRNFGLSDLSRSRKSNMNNCMKYLMDKRFAMMNILKLNRYLSDANWSLIRSDTVLRHPYKKEQLSESQINEEVMGDYYSKKNSAFCPNCFKLIPFDITEAEYVEMIKEAQIWVWKSKKVSVIKQYENGMINKSCMQVLTHIFELMIEFDLKKDILNIKTYFKKQKYVIFAHKILVYLKTRNVYEPPKAPHNRFCFYLSMHFLYDYVLYVFILIYSGILIYCLFFAMATTKTLLLISTIAFHIIFIIDAYMKIFGFYNEEMMEAFLIYIRQLWNAFDFLLLLFAIVDFVVTITSNSKSGWRHLKKLPLARLVKIFQLLTPLYFRVLRLIENKADSNICFGYDLGTAMLNSCDDVIDTISSLIDNREVREEFYKRLLKEKAAIIKDMEVIQTERPWVAITVKTKQAIRTTLSSMEEVLIQLRVSGFLDKVEYSYINKEVLKKHKMLRSLDFVQPSPPKVIFNEICWMANDTSIIEYLYSNVELVQWQARDVICREGAYSEGIYIVVSGLLRITYTPKHNALEKMKSSGVIPIVDYMSTLHYEETFEDRIMSGNSFGELSLLTGRPYDCNVVAESSCEAYLLRYNVVKNALPLNKDPVRGLEARMWKCATINLAVAILLEIPAYQYYSQEQIKFKLERAFVPNIRAYKMFVVTELIEDVILLDGMVADFFTGEIFIAPSVLPKTTQKIIFPRSSAFLLKELVETKIMIIAVGIDRDYDIMELEEDIGELVSVPSSNCLLNKSQLNDYKYKRRSTTGTMDKESQSRSVMFIRQSNGISYTADEINIFKGVEMLHSSHGITQDISKFAPKKSTASRKSITFKY